LKSPRANGPLPPLAATIAIAETTIVASATPPGPERQAIQTRKGNGRNVSG
jgi:hypothetical protein